MIKCVNKTIFSFITFFVSLNCLADNSGLIVKVQQLINEDKYVDAYHLMMSTSEYEYGHLAPVEQLEWDYLYCRILKNAYESSYEPYFKSQYVGALEKLLFVPDIYERMQLNENASKYSELIKDLSLLLWVFSWLSKIL